MWLTWSLLPFTSKKETGKLSWNLKKFSTSPKEKIIFGSSNLLKIQIEEWESNYQTPFPL